LVVKITVKIVEQISFFMAQKLLEFNEPIPDFSTCSKTTLESCLATPFQTFGGKFLYPGLLKKASILFYLMIKNHPFENGNKRIAITTLLVFLFINKCWLRVDIYEFYRFTVWVASSPPLVKDSTIMAIETFLKKHAERIDIKNIQKRSN
jgi:death-on-curing protein